MKFIHAADLHLSSKIEGDLKSKSEDIKKDIKNAFLKMISYANQYHIELILLSGDMFDSDFLLKRDLEFFYNEIKKNPSITFYYLKGNHDLLSENITLPNLKTFKDSFTYYEYKDLVIAGLELTKENESIFLDTLILNKDKFNIVMLHGDFLNRMNQFLNKNINYLALGHIHKMSYEVKGNMLVAYSGVMVGRGFDECGEKGFLVYDTSNLSKIDFVRTSKRVIFKEDVDCSNFYNMEELIDFLKKRMNPKDIYKISFKGLSHFYIDIKALNDYFSDYYFVLFLDLRKKVIDFKKYLNEESVKGFVARDVLASNLNEDKKEDVLNIIFNALGGDANGIN